MAHNVNVFMSSENDNTTRNNVPDWLIHFWVEWTDDQGQAQEHEADEYFLLLINWLRQNHPAAAKSWMERIAFEIARVKYGVDAEFVG